MGKVLETAWRKGAKLDAWEEYFSLDRWLEAFDQCGLDPHFYANRTREKDELMPWAHDLQRRHGELSLAGAGAGLCRGHHPGLPHPLQRLRRQPAGRRKMRCLSCDCCL